MSRLSSSITGGAGLGPARGRNYHGSQARADQFYALAGSGRTLENQSVHHVLITGGAGFIGSHLAEALIARNYRVTVIDDESTGSTENLAAIREHFHFSYVQGSVADKGLLRQVLSDVDEVYHLAAAVGVQLISSAPIHTIETNIYPTELLLSELLRRGKQGHSVKLFIASSSEVYGKNPKAKFSEDDDLVFGPTTRSRWAYGASKAIDEFLAIAYWRQHQLPVVIGRFFNVVGARQSGRYGMVMPRFVEAALTGRPLVVHDDGQQIRCFAHVSDVVRAVTDLMHTPKAVAGVFNIGSDQPISILDLAKRVVAMVKPGLPIEHQTYAAAYDEDFEDVRCRVPDLTRIHQMINFTPTHDLDAAIRDVIDHTRLRLRKAAQG